MKKNKCLKYLLFVLCFILANKIQTFANSISYEIGTTPSKIKTLTWYVDNGDAEYRYLSRNASAGDFSSATVCSGSLQITANGVYTIYAKVEETILYITVPVTTIDTTSPEITINNIIQESDGTLTVHYSCSDYFGVSDTRIAAGNLSVSSFGSARGISGGIIRNLAAGTYTIFAKDVAGNIATYKMVLTASETSQESSSIWESEWETEWSSEYGGSDFDYTVEAPKPTNPIETLPPETKEPQTEPPEPTKPNPTESSPEPTKPNPTEPTPEPTKPNPTEPTSEPTKPNPIEPIPDPTEPTRTNPDAVRPNKPGGSSSTSRTPGDSSKGPGVETTETPVIVTEESITETTQPQRPTEKSPVPPKLPQTGGIGEARSLSFAGAVVLLIVGSCLLAYIKRKEDSIDKEE